MAFAMSRQQVVIFLALYIAYGGYYVTKKNYGLLVSSLIEEEGLTKMQANCSPCKD